ncbi:MAG: hypothetical protein U0822_06390 [Anaerolineae bacterium]
MLKRGMLIVVGLGMMVVIAGCGGAPSAGPATAPTATRGAASPTLPAASGAPQAATPPQPESAKPPATGSATAVANAQADLARRLGIAPASIAVAQAESVTWPDASLGCPQPGVMYMQIVTPGYRVVLSAGGREYDYRATSDGQVRLCERPAGTPPAAPSPTAAARGEIAVPTTSAPQGGPAASGPWAKQIDAATADLLKHEPTLKASDIHVQTAEAVTWNDGSLGCAQPGMMYTMALVPGYRVVLEANGKTYSYHGAQGQPPKLCENPRLPGGTTTAPVQ